MANPFHARVIVVLLGLLLVACGAEGPAPTGRAPAAAATPASDHATPHYTITSSADPATSARASVAAEALFSAYSGFFGLEAQPGRTPLRIRLYGTRAEFHANNRRLPWAEGYYLDGVCHAYFDPDKANPYHWLLHEAVHQLNRELTGFAKERWLNEGLATYFGSSRYEDGRLQAGVPDFDTYPLWWLDSWELSGEFDADVKARQVIPLRALVTGQGGPPLAATVNAHYLGYWSLTHFLLHHEGGRYAEGYRTLLREGGSLDAFERHIGPVAEIQPRWYAHLRDQIEQRRRSVAPAIP